jgi:1-deoxy-D-xylulose-5-phosphate reductoisomerase
MGAKITIDSATPRRTRGLEVIEAHWLYDVEYDAIEVVIHPQSVVHSAVRFVDGFPQGPDGQPRYATPDPVRHDLSRSTLLTGRGARPDLDRSARLPAVRTPERFPALRIAREAGIAGRGHRLRSSPADDVAVERFLAGSLDFLGIPRLLEDAVERFGSGSGEPDIER